MVEDEDDDEKAIPKTASVGRGQKGTALKIFESAMSQYEISQP